MTRPVVLLDVDGVLADFLGASLAFLRTVGVDFIPEDIWTFDIAHALNLDDAERAKLDREWSRPGFCAALAPCPGAREGVELLRSVGEVYAVTAPMWSCPTWEHERRAWLIEQMGFPAKHVVSAHAKHLIAGAVLVDDRPSHLESWKHGTPVCWAQPYNENYAGIRTNDWRVVADIANPIR